jgi:RNase H-like domain found in reverse transcriptase
VLQRHEHLFDGTLGEFNIAPICLNLLDPGSKSVHARPYTIVNYYRDMWFRRSELLAPLTSLTSGNVKFEWLPSHQQAFDKIKGIETEVLLAYPDFDKPFHIYTDASDHQLGAVNMHNKKPIAFYSRKLNAAQRRYTITERELLSTIETCKEYKNILLGYPIIVYTDHTNNTIWSLASQNSTIRPLGHGLCRSGGSFYHKNPTHDTLSACSHYD